MSMGCMSSLPACLSVGKCIHNLLWPHPVTKVISANMKYIGKQYLSSIFKAGHFDHPT